MLSTHSLRTFKDAFANTIVFHRSILMLLFCAHIERAVGKMVPNFWGYSAGFKMKEERHASARTTACRIGGYLGVED